MNKNIKKYTKATLSKINQDLDLTKRLLAPLSDSELKSTLLRRYSELITTYNFVECIPVHDFPIGSWGLISAWKTTLMIMERTFDPLDEDDFTQVIKSYTGYNERSPDSVYYTNLGFLYYVAEKYNESLDYLNQAVSLNEENEYAQNILGSLYQKINKPDLADSHLSQSLNANKYYTPAYFNLARLRFNRNEYEQSINTLNKIIESEYNDFIDRILAILERAFMKAINSKNESAIQDLDWILHEEVEPKMLHETMFCKALILEIMKSFETAISCYIECIKIQTDQGESYFRCGCCYEKAGMLKEAKQNWEKSLILGYEDGNKKLRYYGF